MIQTNCFWYRPWRDASVQINQCVLQEAGECTCEKNCINFIEKGCADALVLTVMRNSNLMEDIFNGNLREKVR